FADARSYSLIMENTPPKYVWCEWGGMDVHLSFSSFHFLQQRSSTRQSSLQHRPGVTHVINLPAESAAAHLCIASLNTVPFAVVINRARVFGIKSSRIFLPRQFPHDSKHVNLSLVQKDLGVFFIRLPDDDVTEMDVVDRVARAEIASHRHRVFAQFASHSAVKGDAVGGAFDDVHHALPSG